MKKETYGAVVLAAGKGKRMHSAVQKQFLCQGKAGDFLFSGAV